MCAGSGSSVDQLFESKIRELLNGNEGSAGVDLVGGSAVKRPFVAAKKEARQAATQLRQNSFTV